MNPLALDAGTVMSLAGLLFPGSKNKRLYSAGEMLNEQTAGSAADVQKQASAQFVSKVEARNDRLLRNRAEAVTEGGRVTNPNHGSHQLQSFQIPTSIRA